MRERFSRAWRAFQAPPAPAQALLGEIALADTRRLFPGGPSVAYNPGWLVKSKGLDIFEQMRRDDQVKAALTFKKRSVLAAGWRLVSPEGYPEEWEPTVFVQWVFDHMDRGDVGGTIEHDLVEIMSALDYGFSVTEKVYAPILTGPWAGRIGLQALKTRHPREFMFEQDGFGNVTALLQPSNPHAPKGRLPIDKFVLWTYQPAFGNPYGTSDLEAAYKPWWLKENVSRWLAILLERLGIPPVFGLYNPTGYTPQQIDDLKQIIQNLQAATFGILPRGAKDDLEFWTPELAGQSNRVFIPAIELCDRQISRALLMPGLLGLTGDETQGSLARARVHFDAFLLVLQAIQGDLRDTVLMHQVVKPLVDLNFPGVEDYPGWEWLPLTDEVRLDLLERWGTLAGAGAVTQQPEDEAHIRQLLSFPERQAAPPTVLRQHTQLRRPDAFERQVDFAAIQRGLDGAEAEMLAGMREVLLGTREALVGFIERNFEGRAPGWVQELRLRGMGDLQEVARESLRRVFEDGRRALRREVARKLQTPPFTPAEALRYLSSYAVTIAGLVRDRLTHEAQQILLNALKFGENPRETIQKLLDLFEPYVGDQSVIRDDRLIQPWRLETIVRTNLTNAFNHGRLIEARQDEDVLVGMRYSAVLDSRTTPVCRLLDQKVFKMTDPELDFLTPPNHHNCRSLLVALPVGMAVPEGDFLTPAEAGQAKMLAGEGFK